ncbi:MAG: hypothetical protein KatS3mg104_2813 [Phycisphaerae bacterium]|jgi:hypothetical protein|nr:MAG: hypothetical protein KatS3mg104_2813 [Phycisphaerae bacterium]
MAKGKKGPALFEVIRAAQQKQLEQQKRLEQQKKSGPGVLTTAAAKLRELSWLKPRSGASTSARPIVSPTGISGSSTTGSSGSDRPQADVNSVNSSTMVERAPDVPRPVVMIESTPMSLLTPAEDIARQVREEIAAASRIPDTCDDPTPDPVLNRVSELFGTSDPSERTPVEPRRVWSLPFRVSYTTGLAAGIALLVIASLILVFTRINRSVDSSGLNLAGLTPRPDVLEVGSVAPSETPSRVVSSGNTEARANVTASPTGKVSVESSLRPIPLPPSGKRIVGVQYVVLLSVPREEPAQELVKFLASKGISVTAEKGLPGYSQTWYSVVTTTGFQRTRNNPEFDDFIEPINKVMKEYANGSRFKSFKPDIYTWRMP